MRGITLYIMLLTSSLCSAQLFNNGTQIHIEEGGIVAVKGTDFINNGEVTHKGYLLVDNSIYNELTWYCDSSVQSTVELGLNWENNDAFTSGIGQFNFIGNDQKIGGSDPTDFYILNLKGDRLAVKSLGNDISVEKSLDLNDAELACNNNTTLMDVKSQEIDRDDGFVSTDILGRLNRDFTLGKTVPSTFPLGVNRKGKVFYRPIVLQKTKRGTFRTAFLYRDPSDYNFDTDLLQDSLCTVNDEYFHIVGSDFYNTADFGIVTGSINVWTTMADWQNQWTKITQSGIRQINNEIGFGTERYINNTDRAIVLATESPFVETVEKLVYVEYKESVKLEPEYLLPENSTMRWRPPEFLDCDDCPFPTYTAGLPRTYTIEVDNGVGCFDSDTVRVEVIRGKDNPILIPNAFSPNGDMLNERFKPHLYSFEELVSLRIYNRWGELIYDGIDGWDGTYMGKDVQMGAYMYMAEIKELIKGGFHMSNYESGMVNVIR